MLVVVFDGMYRQIPRLQASEHLRELDVAVAASPYADATWREAVVGEWQERISTKRWLSPKDMMRKLMGAFGLHNKANQHGVYEAEPPRVPEASAV